jgi:Cdc6-like AAA superfamily ATPase
VKLPERTLSTLQPVLINAEPYTGEEIGQIFKERVERAFKPDTVSDRLLTMIAKTACEVGDVRFGFRILLTAALLAEKARRQTIEAGDIASAVEEEKSPKNQRARSAEGQAPQAEEEVRKRLALFWRRGLCLDRRKPQWSTLRPKTYSM